MGEGEAGIVAVGGTRLGRNGIEIGIGGSDRGIDTEFRHAVKGDDHPLVLRVLDQMRAHTCKLSGVDMIRQGVV